MSKGNRQRRRELGLLPPREYCKARKRDGNPCGMAPLAGSVVCRMHGGAAPQVLRKSQERIVMAQDDAAGNLVKWMQDATVPFSERRKCAEALLNRGGNAPGQRLEVSLDVQPWQQIIDGIVGEVPDDLLRDGSPVLAELTSGDVVDGEVLDAPTLPLARPVPTTPAPPAEEVRIPSRRRGGRRVAGR